MSKPKNMTLEEESAWKSRRRAVARACYRRNAPEVISRVAAYKAKKKAKKAVKAKIDKRPCCTNCGARVDSKNDYRKNHDQCQVCRDEEVRIYKIEEAGRFLKIYKCTEEQAGRKWFKFVCKENRYDPVVFIDSEFDCWEYMKIEATEVVSLLDWRERHTKSGKYRIKGYYRWNTKSHGFFSDNGKAGIHDMGSPNSHLAKAFWEMLLSNGEKQELAWAKAIQEKTKEHMMNIRIRMLEKTCGQIRQQTHAVLDERKKAEAAIQAKNSRKSVNSRMPWVNKSWKSASVFFQITNAAAAISEHSKTA